MPHGEISTDGIVYDALDRGKHVFVPYTYKSIEEGKSIPVMDMLELQSPQDFASFHPDNWGIPTASEESVPTRLNCFGGKGKTEPKNAAPANGHTSSGLDLVVMPGVLFDRNMGRLGHGAGFYDRFLHRHQSHCTDNGTKMPFLVALALNEQLLPANESVPMDATDWRVDAVITGDGTLHQK
jgi:5-formyltetrahydrofolate cyclo-ligase